MKPGKASAAVVVTYHPDPDVLSNLAAIRPQIDHLIVVDNGSATEALAPLRDAAAELRFDLIENGDNLGIAKALNIGVLRAQQQHAAWVFLFDQDSRTTEGFAAAMLAAFAAAPASPPLGILVPRYVDQRFHHVLPPPRNTYGQLDAATTSGSLSPMSVFERAGLFAEELFIDGVDYEFSFRVRALGYVIDECAEAKLLHSPGTPSFHRIFGKTFQSANYSPIRRYYQERNKIWVTRKYFPQFFSFCLGQFLISAKDFGKIVCVEDNKAEKISFFLRGVLDGLRGRMGRYSPR